MEYVTLGKTGLRVSRMGLGGIPEQDYVIALAIDGKTPDSVELSQKLRNWEFPVSVPLHL